MLGRMRIGYIGDRFGKIQSLTASFILRGLPGVTVAGDGTGVPTTLLTLFVVCIGIFGSDFISLFAVVVAHLFGPKALASKIGLLDSAIGVSVLAWSRAIYAIIESGVPKLWTIGVLTSGLFLFVGGLVLLVAGSAMQHKAQALEASQTSYDLSRIQNGHSHQLEDLSNATIT